jgi:hypothetical protein
MSETVTVNVGKDFSRFPSGRTPRDSAFSGEAFREKFLRGPLEDGKDVIVELDDAISYGSSFLEESFGGLVRVYGMSKEALLQNLKLISFDELLIDEIRSYIKLA